MELLHLKYFQTIARLESVTQAAEELHVSQPALSKILARLEAELGRRLFDRRSRKLRLNAAGQAFLSHVQHVFQELQEARQAVQSLSDMEDSSVVAASSSSRLLPNLLTSYLRQYPHGRFQLRQITELAAMQKELLMERIDFCLSFQPLRHKEFVNERLAREPILLAVAPEHPMARRESVALEELQEEKFISLTSECGLRELTTVFCEQAGFQPDICFEINSLEVIANLVEAGLGIAFVPAFWREYKQGIGPVQIPIRNPGFHRDVWISYRKNAPLSLAQQRFLAFVQRYFAGSSVK